MFFCRVIFLSVIVLVSISVTPAFANKTTTKNASTLQTIANKISSLKKSLFSVKSRRENLQHKLRENELQIGKIAKKITDNKSQLSRRKKSLNKIYREQYQHEKQLKKQKELLAKQLRAAYMLGQQPYLKIILNQENPEEISRYLHYYASLNKARLEVISEIKKTVVKINKTAAVIQYKKKALQKTHYALKSQKSNFKKKQGARYNLLNKINREIKGKSKQLKKLQADKQRLEAIVKGLNLAKTYGYIPGKSFRQMRRKLHWPFAGGRVVQFFGQNIAEGRMQSTGLLIRAKAGTKVHAIFPGKVVYAGWLHGFGLLVIIRHGSSYMTLYGRNQSLYVERNDTVKAGQVIATVGNSGGFQDSALYFEIRHKAVAVNPSRWLQKL